MASERGVLQAQQMRPDNLIRVYDARSLPTGE